MLQLRTSRINLSGQRSIDRWTSAPRKEPGCIVYEQKRDPVLFRYCHCLAKCRRRIQTQIPLDGRVRVSVFVLEVIWPQVPHNRLSISWIQVDGEYEYLVAISIFQVI